MTTRSNRISDLRYSECRRWSYGQHPAPPRTLRPSLPPRLEQAILKALEKDRDERWQSAAELRADLTRVKRGDHGALETPIRPAVTPARRSRLGGLAFALFIAASVATSGWFLWNKQEPEDPPRPAQQETPPPPEQQQPPAPRTAEPVAPSPTPALPKAPPPDATARRQAESSIPIAPPQTPTRPPPVPELVLDPGNSPAGGRGLRGRTARGFGLGGPALVKMLRNVPPETYDLVYAANDPEAMRMALQIREVLSNGGWTNASTTEFAAPQVRLGIFVPALTPGVQALRTWATRSGLDPDYRRNASLPRPRIVIGKQDN